MIILGLLLIPTIIALAVMVIFKQTVTLKEFLIQETALIFLICVGYAIGCSGQTSDTELLNGTVKVKDTGTTGCCHSYPCNCRQICSGSGKNQSCSTVCDTCYWHSYDKYWTAEASTGHVIYHSPCNSPNTTTPERWAQIIVGEPTAVESSYTNYIKASPDSVLRVQGLKEKYINHIPKYPSVYDYYRADRFIVRNVNIPNLKQLNHRLSEINGNLGSSRQVNIIVVVVSVENQEYLQGLREAWLGGKKNDLIVVVGVAKYPDISWAGVLSWTSKEDIKISIRDRILDTKQFDGMKILNIIEEETRAKFVRRPMADFEYLSSSITPPTWVIWFLFVLGILISGGLSVFFHYHDFQV